jgi:RNA polymerase sigma-70 factor (ECF subfamily)
MTTATIGPWNFGEADLITCVPHLRAFARSLTGHRERSDDLVQDTIVRALTAAHQFQTWTNLKAWMFTILRNLHYGELRKNHGRRQLLDDTATHEPAMPPTQEANLEVRDFRRAFGQLGDDQREVLILVGASGLSYEEAAQVCDCPIGTIKSRVSRARRTLLWLLDEGSPVDVRRNTPRRPEDHQQAQRSHDVVALQPSMAI